MQGKFRENELCSSREKFYLGSLVYLVIYDSRWVSLENLLPSWYPSPNESQGQNLALTVLYVPYSPDSGCTKKQRETLVRAIFTSAGLRQQSNTSKSQRYWCSTVNFRHCLRTWGLNLEAHNLFEKPASTPVSTHPPV